MRRFEDYILKLIIGSTYAQYMISLNRRNFQAHSREEIYDAVGAVVGDRWKVRPSVSGHGRWEVERLVEGLIHLSSISQLIIAGGPEEPGARHRDGGHPGALLNDTAHTLPAAGPPLLALFTLFTPTLHRAPSASGTASAGGSSRSTICGSSRTRPGRPRVATGRRTSRPIRRRRRQQRRGRRPRPTTDG